MNYISSTDTARMIRKALAESFAGIKFSVKTSNYAGGSSIGIRWTDGPCPAMVEAVTSIFKGSYFDGSIDYQGSRYAMIDGQQTHFGADYINTRREDSPAAIERAIAQTRRFWGAEKTAAATVEAYQRGELYRVDLKGWHDMDGTLQSQISQRLYKHSFYLAPRKSKSAGRVIYLGNDGYSPVGALNVEG